MTFIAEIYFTFAFFIFFFYGINTYYSISTNFIFRFNGCFFLFLIILFNTILLLNITIFDIDYIFNVTFYKDESILQFENILIFIAFVYIFTSFNKLFKIHYFEYYLIVYISIISSLWLICAYNFILFFLLIEIQSVTLYTLSIFKKTSKASIEATFKYFIMGSVSSFFLLVFIIFLYGSIGFFTFSDIYVFLTLESTNIQFNNIYILCFFFLLISLLFKMYAVPFHFWVADIYESSLVLSTFFFSTFSFLVINFIFFKFYFYFFIHFHFFFKYLYFFFSIFSIIVGALNAISEHRLMKLIAYSSISCTGYYLSFFFINDLFFIVSSINFVIVYIFNLIPIFILICNVQMGERDIINNLFDLVQFCKYNFFLSSIIFFLFFAISGIPVSIFFLFKLYYFLYISNESYYFILILFFINAIFSIFYCVRILKFIFYIQNSSLFTKSYFYKIISKNAFFFFFFFSYLNIYFFIDPPSFILIPLELI
jgi:NADH-quinone oxidoreductase subunit N